MTAYTRRTYRGITENGDFASFEAVAGETDLKVYVDKSLEPELPRFEALTVAYISGLRAELENYIAQYPQFAETLEPWPLNDIESPLVQSMVNAGNLAGTGPMAAVAGAFAQFTALHLLSRSQSVMVENGGDIYAFCRHKITAGVFAGQSPLSMRLGFVIPAGLGLGVCTSSGTVGHSLSFGRADAACVAATDAALADALATALGNMVYSEKDFTAAIDKAQKYDEVLGVMLICGAKSAIWGELEVKPL